MMMKMVMIVMMVMTMMITISYSSIQNLPSLLLLSKNIRIRYIIIWMFSKPT